METQPKTGSGGRCENEHKFTVYESVPQGISIPKVKITPPLGTAGLFPHKEKASCGVQHLKKDLCPDRKFNSGKIFSGQ